MITCGHLIDQHPATMLKLSHAGSLSLALAGSVSLGTAQAYENSAMLLYVGQPNNLATYSNSAGTMAVSPPGGGGFDVPTDHTSFVSLPGQGVTIVVTPSSTKVPSRISTNDQRSSTYRNISAKCLNPATQIVEACDFGDESRFPRTRNAPGTGFYNSITQFAWDSNAKVLTIYTPDSGRQSNGAYIDLPPYVREITMTAYGSGGVDASFGDIFMADAPSVSKTFAPASTTPGGTSTLTIQLKNPDLNGVVPDVNVTDVLPAPLKLVSAQHSCTGGALTTNTTSGTISLRGATMPVAGCTITAQVRWPDDTAGIQACRTGNPARNTITSPAQFTTALGQLNGEATADLACTYTAPPAPATKQPIPTLSDMGLLLLSGLTMGLAGFLSRRRKWL